MLLEEPLDVPSLVYCKCAELPPFLLYDGWVQSWSMGSWPSLRWL